jgi:hypothetical protein
MPRVTGDRFSSQNMADCEFCHPGEDGSGRRFRTTRQCAGCGKYLCLLCRPWVPQVEFLCPDCGGGPRDNAIHDPAAAVKRLQDSGHTAPYWLLVLHERAQVSSVEVLAEEIVPE